MHEVSFKGWGLLILLMALIGCTADITRENEQNPYYQSGLELQEAGRHKAAAEAFRECLKYSPSSYKAHLQLAMLYEDSLQDLPRAIVHYRDFLAMAPKSENVAVVAGFLEQAEISYLAQLRKRYGDEVNGPPPSASLPPIIESPSIRPPAPPKPVSTPTVAAATYAVQSGDTLSAIARRVYGDPERWREIYTANRHQLSAPDQLKVGMILNLPPR